MLKTISKTNIEQEVAVGLPDGIQHGHALRMALNGKVYVEPEEKDTTTREHRIPLSRTVY